jgi:hypothetical protein
MGSMMVLSRRACNIRFDYMPYIKCQIRFIHDLWMYINGLTSGSVFHPEPQHGTIVCIFETHFTCQMCVFGGGLEKTACIVDRPITLRCYFLCYVLSENCSSATRSTCAASVNYDRRRSAPVSFGALITWSRSAK